MWPGCWPRRGRGPGRWRRWWCPPWATAGPRRRSAPWGARGCSRPRSRPRCSTAGPTSPCIRPRTFRLAPPTGWRWPRCPPGPTRGTPWWAALWPTWPRRPGWPPARPAAGPSSPGCGPIWSSASCGATSRPGWPRRSASTPSSWPPPPWIGSAWPRRWWTCSTRRSCCPRPVRGPWPWSAGPATPPCWRPCPPSSTGRPGWRWTPSGPFWPNWAATAPCRPGPSR